jgi:excinuclease ABC subunit C
MPDLVASTKVPGMMWPMNATAPANIAHLPVGPGVYRFRTETGSTLYIGRSANLRSRVASYWGDLGDRKRLARMVPQIARIEAVACDSAHEAAWLERNLLERRRPRWNRAIGGQEVPVYIRLDCGPRSSGVTMVHEPQPSLVARHFGPYLGGTKVRLAVSGLNRMLPLAYASEGLAGSGRDMARVLGVEQEDREGLLRSLAAVLEKDPVAVVALRTALERRRDEAAESHAFERAARLHAEMSAIEWVVAEQNVAVLDPIDLSISAWAGGVLVSFEMRGGRICRWEQRSCSEAAARRHVELTPAGYVDFGRRNAELAARLRASPAVTAPAERPAAAGQNRRSKDGSMTRRIVSS